MRRDGGLNEMSDLIAARAAELAALYARASTAARALPASDAALWRGLRRAATAYAILRLDWSSAPLGSERAAVDDRRSLAHDVFIDACNALSRRCGAHDLDQTWRRDLGDSATLSGRKAIGDFACFIAFVVGLEAR
jgi:hypothetical protein